MKLMLSHKPGFLATGSAHDDQFLSASIEHSETVSRGKYGIKAVGAYACHFFLDFQDKHSVVKPPGDFIPVMQNYKEVLHRKSQFFEKNTINRISVHPAIQVNVNVPNVVGAYEFIASG
ncbi:hypothetical protein INH39_01335 [Massilia violaceinigra]|uniref:Uncharacterized protein n=1 Tax=Massilia violaceinigra TaxID=2045208 RepID=A0ABY4A6M9_9BURK|nr:hypothetical protein [Massilia violaceinigra]UOD30430.1 hypothetical protein INH39_01335 [Massilia violaceinigra]